MDRVAHALELINTLTSTPTVNSAVTVFERAVEPFGVKVYTGLARGNWIRDPKPVLTVSNWADEWREFYEGNRAFTFDPVAAAARHADGFFWRDLPEATSSDGRKLMRDAQGFGMVDGFTAVYRTNGELSTSMNLGGTGLEWTDLERGVVRFVGASLMSRMLYLRDVSLTPKVKSLSPREADILSHAALGHDDHRIAAELGAEYNTIRSHWRSIRQKLGAADRAQAVAVGLWSGQILP